MSIIEELYYGNVRPWEMKYNQTEEYENAIKEYVNNETKFLEKLSDEERELFNKMTECKLSMDAIEGTEKFKVGFKLGIKLMCECFNFESE